MEAAVFVALTISLTVVPAASILIVWRIRRRSHGMGAVPELGVYELALLAGGRLRMLDVALVRLSTEKAVRLRRDGRVTRRAAVPEGTHPVEAEVLALLEARRDGVAIGEIRTGIALEGAAASALAGRLRESKLMEDGGEGIVLTHQGEAVLSRHRLRHREEAAARAGERSSAEPPDLVGVALHGLSRLRNRELAGRLYPDGTEPYGTSREAGRRGTPAPGRYPDPILSPGLTCGLGGGYGDGGDGDGDGGGG